MPYVLFVLAFLVSLLEHADSSSVLAAAHGEHASLCRVLASSHRPSTNGTFDLTITRIRPGAGKVYLNVVADLNNDGSIKPYSMGRGGEQQEWIVRNVPLPAGVAGKAGPSFSVWFDMPDLSLFQGDQRNVKYVLTLNPLDLPFAVPLTAFTEWDSETMALESTGWGFNDERGQRLLVQAAGSHGAGPQHDTVVNAADHIAMFPDLPQRSNECGPTSAANAVLWLAQRLGFEQKLPLSPDGSIDTATVITDLMEAMAGNADRPFKGLTGNEMYDGIAAYVDHLHLPLKITGGSRNLEARGPAAVDFLVRCLAANAPAELLIWMPDGSGHWVTVTGFALEQSRSFLFVHDPDDKKTATAIWEVSRRSDGKANATLALPSRCSLGWAIAEEPVLNGTNTLARADEHSAPASNAASSAGDARAEIFSLDIH